MKNNTETIIRKNQMDEKIESFMGTRAMLCWDYTGACIHISIYLSFYLSI